MIKFKWKIVIFFIILASSSFAQKKEVIKNRVAILPFEPKESVTKNQSDLLTDTFIEAFSKTQTYKLVSRTDIKKIIDEQKFQKSEYCSDTECAVEFGKILSAEKVIIGSVGMLGKSYLLVLHLIDVETSEQICSARRDFEGDINQFLKLMPDMAYELLCDIKEIKTSPTPKPKPTEIISIQPPKPQKSNLEALKAYEELLSEFEKRDFSYNKQLSYLEAFVSDWQGTAAASNAQDKITELKNIEKLTAEAQSAYGVLEREESLEILTYSQAAQRKAKWDEYLNKYSATKYKISEAKNKQEYYKNWRPLEAGDIETIDLGGGVKLEMVWVPGGTYEMGNKWTPEEIKNKYGGETDWYKDEYPVHTVKVDGFWMGKYEVTNEQYRCYKSNHSSKDYDGFTLNDDKQPAVNISWDDAKSFCDWLSNKTGKEFRLPTEAEWEYACRAGTDTQRYWGDDDETMGQYANVADRTAKSQWSNWVVANTNDGYKVAAPVGKFKPNKFGLYDMIGNVWEWCEDWYGENYYSESPRENPKGPSSGAYRVLRGGSWYSLPWDRRSACRYRFNPGGRSSDVGFRLLRIP